MKILIISTSDIIGGAAIAAKRMTKALRDSGQDAKMLVNIKSGNEIFVQEYAQSSFKKKLTTFIKLFEKILFIPKEISKQERYSFSTALFGENLLQHPLVKEADILHLHWVNHGFLSYKHLGELIKTGKPIFITMHDMWYMTGGCHHARECTNYQNQCGNCVFIKGNSENDLSRIGYLKKKSIYTNDITFIPVSKWLENLTRESSLLQNNRIVNIPNPLDIKIFHQKDKIESQKRFNLKPNKTYILYAAAKVDNIRKGYEYLSKALGELFHSDLSIKKNIEIVVMGRVKDQSLINFHFPTHFIGNLTSEEEVIACYNAVDLFIAPSLEENLPNTIIESMACGTPAVAFGIGGVPEIIDHKVNGYVAEYKNASDLIEGVKWILSEQNLSEKCINKVSDHFSEEVVAKQIIDLYQDIKGK